jgi:nickel transport protein
MKQFAKLFFLAFTVMLSTVPSLAHGVRINHTIDTTTGEITIMAVFDTGEVLDEAAVVIFAPDDLINPWGTGVMNGNGSYTFTPDYTIEGFWDIQVRKAGHGGLINVELTTDMMPDPTDSTTDTDNEGNARTITLSNGSQVTITGEVNFNVNGDTISFETEQSTNDTATSTVQSVADTQRANGFTTAQIVIMSLSIIWGFVGTALYFTRRKPKLQT